MWLQQRPKREMPRSGLASHKRVVTHCLSNACSRKTSKERIDRHKQG